MQDYLTLARVFAKHVHAETQTHELSCKREFKMQSVQTLNEVEKFIKNQLFCDVVAPCTVFMSESYKQFRMECFRAIEGGIHGTMHAGRPVSTRADKCEVYLDNHWKMELVGDTVYVMRLETRVLAGVCETGITGIRKRAELDDFDMDEHMHGSDMCRV